jgi:transposase
VVLFWHLLTSEQDYALSEQDYAFGRPTLTRKKLRRLELAAGAPRGKGASPSIWAASKALRQAELEVALQAETAYRRLVSDWQPNNGAGATPGRASQGRQSGKQRGKASVPDPAL